MIATQKWFERKFDFSYPVSRFPCIFERVRGTPARLEELVNPLPQKILTVKPDGKWSIQEHAGHLYDLDELHDRRIDDYLAGAATLRSADLKNNKTEAADHNASPLAEVLKRFREARGRFAARLEALDERELSLSAIHPRLQQPMRLVDMALFVAEHDDHHLASIAEIARSLGRR